MNLRYIIHLNRGKRTSAAAYSFASLMPSSINLGSCYWRVFRLQNIPDKFVKNHIRKLLSNDKIATIYECDIG